MSFIKKLHHGVFVSGYQKYQFFRTFYLRSKRMTPVCDWCGLSGRFKIMFSNFLQFYTDQDHGINPRNHLYITFAAFLEEKLRLQSQQKLCLIHTTLALQFEFTVNKYVAVIDIKAHFLVTDISSQVDSWITIFGTSYNASLTKSFSRLKTF